MDAKKKMVIIGGGFAGLNVAKNIDKNAFDVTIIDRNNYHSFPPLFYQVASSGLEPASISFPLRRELRRRRYRGCRYHMGDVTAVDTVKKEVVTKYDRVPYDVLVVAAGSTNNFFGIPALEKYVYTLKSTSQAIRCRNEILDRLERASITPDPERRRRLLTFVVVGGGPTGVEIAGALGEFKRYGMKKEYPAINIDEVRVLILEGTDRLLRTMTERSSDHARRSLEQLMVEVKLGHNMKSYTEGVVELDNGEKIAADTVIWTAGVTGVSIPFLGSDVKPTFGGRIAVDEYNAVEGLEDVYAIGDIALHTDGKYPRGLPQVAPVAVQQGEALARNLNDPGRRRPFEYRDKGSMATIGRNRAVVDMGKMHLSGWLAWLVWMFVHLISLMGMRNKLVVMINWTVSYFTFSSGLRLLLRPGKYPLRQTWSD